MSIIEKKKCSKCGVEKPLDCFGNNTSGPATHASNGKRYKRPECKDCTRKAAKDRRLSKKLAENAIAPPEGSPCDLCGKPPLGRFKKLRFDHCHESLIHRGWLCDPCNRSLGILGDNVESLIKVVNYINKTENKSLKVDDKGLFVEIKE